MSVTTTDAHAEERSAPTAGTVGELRASGHRARNIREEIRGNLLTMLAAGTDPWPGLHGFGQTVLPQIERALLAGHDLVLLGERGQGKTRLLRSLPALLDEWTPVIADAELGEHPYHPITPESLRRAAELGDSLPISWRPRRDRYSEKLATPDTSVADLIGDVDPMKVAEGRHLGDPETIHYGLVPRTHRGIMAINELPDLAERIQVSLLNVMEERDVQVRGHLLRLPLDVLLVASANPEDYTNRGRIITPLKDRFGAEIRTHYPRNVADEIAMINSEAALVAEVPALLVEVVARFVHLLRDAEQVNQRSGVSARYSIAGVETVAAAALHRATVLGEPEAVARPIDLTVALPVLAGKIEWEAGYDDRADELIEHLLRLAVADTVRQRLDASELTPLVDAIERGAVVVTGPTMSAGEFLAALPADPVFARIAELSDAHSSGARTSAIELALEGLYLSRRIAKDLDADGTTVYG